MTAVLCEHGRHRSAGIAGIALEAWQASLRSAGADPSSDTTGANDELEALEAWRNTQRRMSPDKPYMPTGQRPCGSVVLGPIDEEGAGSGGYMAGGDALDPPAVCSLALMPHALVAQNLPRPPGPIDFAFVHWTPSIAGVIWLFTNGRVQFDTSEPHGAWAQLVNGDFSITFHWKGEQDKVIKHWFQRVRNTNVAWELVERDGHRVDNRYKTLLLARQLPPSFT